MAITNVTDEFGVLVVAGPKSRATLRSLTGAELSNAAFPWLSAREMEIASITVCALVTAEAVWDPKNQRLRG